MTGRIAAAASVAVLLAGCAVQPSTPATAPTTPAVTPASASPSPSWDAGQAAALAALQGYQRTRDVTYADPAAYSRAKAITLIGEFAGWNLLEANLSALDDLRKKDRRREGAASVTLRSVTPVKDNHSSRGLEVHISMCEVYGAIRVVSATGEVVAKGSATPVLQQYSVRRAQGSKRWLVYGAQSAGGCQQ